MRLMRRVVAGLVTVAMLVSGCSRNEEDAAQVQPVDLGTVTWASAPAGLSYPKSEKAGPFEKKSVPRGFSDDLSGAVIAAVVAEVYMAGADDESWPEVSRELLEPGQGRDQWAQARALVSVDGKVDDPARFVGYSVTSDSPEDAVVVLGIDYPGQSTVGYPVQMSHKTGSWRVVVPIQGEEPDARELSNDEVSKLTKF